MTLPGDPDPPAGWFVGGHRKFPGGGQPVTTKSGQAWAGRLWVLAAQIAESGVSRGLDHGVRAEARIDRSERVGFVTEGGDPSGPSSRPDRRLGRGEEGDLRHSPIVVLCGTGRFLAGRRSRVLHVAERHLGPLWRTLSAGDIEAGVPGRIGAWTASWGMTVRRYPKVGCCGHPGGESRPAFLPAVG